MNPEEILALSEDALALFGPDANLVAVSPAFRRRFQPVEAFLTTGTAWHLFLGEAVRHGIVPATGANRLSHIEETLTDTGAPAREATIETANGPARFALSAMSDGGFALRVSRENADADASERELEQIMATVLEACPTCLTMARIGDGHILYRSPEATALLGKGFDSRAHFKQREQRADFITALLPNARVDDMPFIARRADGSPFQASISARLIDYRGEDVIVSSITDLTDELAMRAELERQRKQVFQAEKMSALGEVLAGVAHELNNPLSIVVGNSQLLAEDGIAGPGQKRVEKISEAAERCVSIVRAFLSMARDRPRNVERVPVLELLETARAAFQSAESSTLDIAMTADARLPDLVVDRVQLVQVLTNLLINADQAIGGRADGRVKIEAEAVPGQDRVRLRISDNGPGIPPEIAPRIFDPLFTTKEAGQGTGIGLALCHRIVLANGGSIELDTDAETGATFVVELPTA